MPYRCALACQLVMVLAAPGLAADARGTLIFEDSFERNESQETTDEIGHGWGTNSKSRAGGNKQVDLRDGHMYITTHPTADHAASVTHPAEFRDGAVQLRFQLEHAKDTLGLDFADLQLKTVHAGHLFKVTVGLSKLEISDLKTGVMNLEIYNARKANQLTAEMKQKSTSTRKTFPLSLEAGQWYTLDVDVVGDAVRVRIDGREIGSFKSEGFAHPTKRMLRLSVPHQAVVDDVKIYSAAE